MTFCDEILFRGKQNHIGYREINNMLLFNLVCPITKSETDSIAPF